MKELTLEEVLRIKGGLPPTAALDEETYRCPLPSAGQSVDYGGPDPSRRTADPV